MFWVVFAENGVRMVQIAMTNVETKAYGFVDVPESRILTFVKPILGFEDLEKFAIIDVRGLPGFYWLQSLENKNLAIIVSRPDKLLDQEYVIQIDNQESIFREMKLISRENLTCYLMVNVPQDPKQMTLNLMGPILVNSATLLAAQAISTKYTETKFPVFGIHNDEK
jgi:flagellar assembly factor FliW